MLFTFIFCFIIFSLSLFGCRAVVKKKQTELSTKRQKAKLPEEYTLQFDSS